MLFHTGSFALFFALLWPSYWALRNHTRARTILLTLASWGFYSAWDWRFTGLLLASTGVDYLCARGIAATEDPRARRRWLSLSLCFNLGVLATFKYLDFFASSTAAVLAELGLHASWASLHVVLPVGISFYTLQTLAYTLDVYRGRQTPTADPWQFAAYVAFFPQLVAGPIERASALLPQLEATPRLRAREQVEGVRRFTIGLWKKLIVADNLGVFVDWVFAIPPEQIAGYQVVLGVLGFAGQIWADFSGYTDMALGLAALLGIRLMENFDAPYLARGPREFWRRWHISLSTWLRDYLYIPLGGNQRGPVRTQINLLLTMLLGGLWHGAAWTYIAWGGFHGLWLAAERGVDHLRGRIRGLVRTSPGWSARARGSSAPSRWCASAGCCFARPRSRSRGATPGRSSVISLGCRPGPAPRRRSTLAMSCTSGARSWSCSWPAAPSLEHTRSPGQPPRLRPTNRPTATSPGRSPPSLCSRS